MGQVSPRWRPDEAGMMLRRGSDEAQMKPSGLRRAWTRSARIQCNFTITIYIFTDSQWVTRCNYGMLFSLDPGKSPELAKSHDDKSQVGQVSPRWGPGGAEMRPRWGSDEAQMRPRWGPQASGVLGHVQRNSDAISLESLDFAIPH